MIHLEGDFENLQKACANLENLKNGVGFDKEGIFQLLKEKGQDIKNPPCRIKKLKEIEKGEFAWLIIDRSKSQQGIN